MSKDATSTVGDYKHDDVKWNTSHKTLATHFKVTVKIGIDASHHRSWVNHTCFHYKDIYAHLNTFSCFKNIYLKWSVSNILSFDDITRKGIPLFLLYNGNTVFNIFNKFIILVKMRGY